MNYIYLFLSMLISFSAFSTELKCSKAGTAIVYVNGFGNTRKDARISFQKLRKIAQQNAQNLDRSASGENKLYFNYQYNHTDGLITDLIEAFFQKFRALLPNSTNPYKVWSQYLRLYTFPGTITEQDIIDQLKFDLDRVVENAADESPAAQDTIALAQIVGGYLVADKKAILVSHSQGGLFANEMYRVLQQDTQAASKLKYYSNLMVATPANVNLSGGPWMTNRSDAIIKVFGLPANYEAPSNEELSKYFTEQAIMHGFLEIYTNPKLQGVFSGADSLFDFTQSGSMEQIFAGNLIGTAKLLESNCIQACDGAPGSSPQSNVFVANTARLDPSVTISLDTPFIVEICESAQVYGNANISGKVKISGSAKVHGNATLSTGFSGSIGLYIGGSADIMGNIRAWGLLSIVGLTTLNEGSNVYGLGTIDGTTIGSSEVTIDGTYITDSHILDSRVYSNSFVTNSTISGSEIKGSFVGGSIIENSTVSANSSVGESTVTNSLISNNSSVDSSTIDKSKITESIIRESTLSGLTCSGADIFNNSGFGCYLGGSSLP